MAPQCVGEMCGAVDVWVDWFEVARCVLSFDGVGADGCTGGCAFNKKNGNQSEGLF